MKKYLYLIPVIGLFFDPDFEFSSMILPYCMYQIGSLLLLILYIISIL